MHHVNFDGYFLTVEIEKTCVMSYSNVSLSEEASLNERCKLSHIVYFSIPKSYFSEAVVLIPTVTFHQPLFLFFIAFRSSPSPSAYEFPFYFLRSHESMI